MCTSDLGLSPFILQFHTNWGMNHSWFVAQEINIIEVKGIHIYILIVYVILYFFVNHLVTFIHKMWVFLDRNLHQKHGTPPSCHWGCSYSAKTQIKTLANYCERNKGSCQFISFNHAVFLYGFLPPNNEPLFNFRNQI